LRFELKPIGQTREWMGKSLEYNKELQTFLKDQSIEDAYQTLKPVLDALHEEFINESLESIVVAGMNFDRYFDLYKEQGDITAVEKSLRNEIGEAFIVTAKSWKNTAGNNANGKLFFKKNGGDILTESGILEFIALNADKFSEIVKRDDLIKALERFKGFFTYFSGFSQNRENYYVTKDEKVTAVATRIVHDNLPKFCDNLVFFNVRTDEYLSIFEFLKQRGNALIDKDNKPLFPILVEIFSMDYFNGCLSQHGLEEYNKQIANANFLINLYNQARSKEGGFKRLSLFKTLYKQIGCGKRDTLFFALNCNTTKEAEELRSQKKDAVSVEEILRLAGFAGKEKFAGRSQKGGVETLNDFIDYLRGKDDYFGIYWSKAAINSISNKYFANWYELKELLKEAGIFSGKKSDSDDVKIPDAVELQDLFDVLNNIESNQSVFKQSLFEDKIEGKIKADIVTDSKSVSEALLNLIFHDLNVFAKEFLDGSDQILRLSEYTSGKYPFLKTGCLNRLNIVWHR